MGTFRASDIKPIGWDMQGTPKLNPETGELAGKWRNVDEHAQGKIPEPTPEQVDTYTRTFDEMRALVRTASEDDAEEVAAQLRETMTTALADLGFPREMLECLPPRVFRGLSDHIYSELIEGVQSGNG